MTPGIAMKCERGHTSFLATPDHTVEYATTLAGIMDGTSAMYKIKPRDKPSDSSPLARCAMPLGPGICGAWFLAIAVGFE